MGLKKVSLLLLVPTLLLSCSKEELSNEARLRQAYLNSIEVTNEKIRPLVNLTKTDSGVLWNNSGDKVLLFTLHRYPDSYVEGTTLTIHWDSWLCSVKEYANWYKNNKSNISDVLLRTKQVLGMSHESKNTYITSLWIDPAIVIRPAYVTNPTKEMALYFEEGVSSEYISWFKDQYYYSYETAHLPWTRLGYTYDWSKEAKDRYGLSEFLATDGASIVVDKTLLVEDFAKYCESHY